MSIALYRKAIHCPNCKYDGAAKVKGTGGALAIIGLILLIIGFFFWPLIIAAILLFIIATIIPAKQICPKCKFENPLPLSQWKKQNLKNAACPLCAELINKDAIKCKHCGSDLTGLKVKASDESHKKSLAYKAGKLFK